MTKKSLYTAVLLGAVILLISACDINVIRGTGDLITETREVSNFDSIELAGSGDVVVVQNGNETLSVETDDNVMRFVVSEVRNGTLHLGLESESSISGISPSELVFTVGVADLEGLSVSGSGTIESEAVKTEQIDIEVNGSGEITIDDLVAGDVRGEISGSGNIDLSGTTQDQDVTVGGSGEYRGADLRSESADVSVSGSGNATVWVTGSLDASVSGSGSIDYYGSPEVDQSVSGSGEINSRGGK